MKHQECIPELRSYEDSIEEYEKQKQKGLFAYLSARKDHSEASNQITDENSIQSIKENNTKALKC